MIKNRHAAVWEWLQKCPYTKDLFFSIASDENGGTNLIPSETVAETYIDGSSLRYYDCALTRFDACTLEPNDDMNLQRLEAFELLGRWIEEQMETGNYPDFPEGETIQEISVLANEGGFMAAQDMDLCKYMLQFRIEYLKEKKG